MVPMRWVVTSSPPMAGALDAMVICRLPVGYFPGGTSSRGMRARDHLPTAITIGNPVLRNTARSTVAFLQKPLFDRAEIAWPGLVSMSHGTQQVSCQETLSGSFVKTLYRLVANLDAQWRSRAVRNFHIRGRRANRSRDFRRAIDGSPHPQRYRDLHYSAAGRRDAV